jgi:hypothetical protein
MITVINISNLVTLVLRGQFFAKTDARFGASGISHGGRYTHTGGWMDCTRSYLMAAEVQALVVVALGWVVVGALFLKSPL